MPCTRVSPWRSDGTSGLTIYLKHEEEGRFAITAGKLRKFASILPQLKLEQIQQVAVIGSANSNHVVAACQLLLQNGIQPIPFLKKTSTAGTNQFLLRLLVDESNWRLIDTQDWAQVEELSQQFITEQLASGIATSEIVEGACQPSALPGALTLAQDVQRNAQELKIDFSDIFIDAGTGLSAIALAMGLQDLGIKAHLHITLMADTEEAFWERANQVDAWYAEIYERAAPSWRAHITLHKPSFAASFGSINAQVLAVIRNYAQRGLFTDPIYSAKHIATAEQIISESGSEMGNVLIIHSGGAQVLPGFEQRLFPKL